MDKETLLQELAGKVQTGEITNAEVMARIGAPATLAEQATPEQAPLSKLSVTKMLYVVGVVIILAGIVFFAAQIWDDIGAFGRILITLGIGLVFAGFGSALLLQKPKENIGPIFHVIGGVLIPSGVMVTLSEISQGSVSESTIAASFIILFAAYAALAYVHRNAILTFFAIANFTVGIYFLAAALLDGPLHSYGDFYRNLTMAFGVSYLLLGYQFREGWNKGLVGALNLFGSLGLLGAAFTHVFDSPVWQLLYFFLLAAGLYGAIYLKSRTILVFSTLFLIAHIAYVTGEYFADSIGWPITLVLLGLVFIGLGYFSVKLDKEYIRGSE